MPKTMLTNPEIEKLSFAILKQDNDICWVNQVSPSIERLFFNYQLAPSEVISFILDTESLIGIMGNEHYFLKSSQCPDSQDSNLEMFD